MVNVLEVIIANVPQGRSGNDIIGSSDLSVKVNGKIYRDFDIFHLLIIFRHLFLCVSKGVVSDGEQLRVFPDPFDVPGRCLFSVTESLLDKVSRIF